MTEAISADGLSGHLPWTDSGPFSEFTKKMEHFYKNGIRLSLTIHHQL